MLISEYKQRDFFGGHLDCITFRPLQPSSKVLLFLPGTTELGAGDGTQLAELYKYGYPKLAKAGYDFPFNIVAIQPVNSYSSVSKAILPWIQMEFEPSAIIPIGISLGSIAACDLLAKDPYKLITAFVSLSGKGNPASVAQMRSVQGWAMHGDRDTTVNYSQAIAFYNAYNKYQEDNDLSGKILIQTIIGLGHGGWDQAMSVKPGEDQILQFILQQFGPEPTEGLTYEDGYTAAKDKLSRLIEGL